MATFHPENTGIVIRPLEREAETASGLAVPTEKRRIVDRPSSGMVVAAGDKCSWVKVGMHVYFDKYKCVEITNPENNEPLGAVIEADVFGRIE